MQVLLFGGIVCTAALLLSAWLMTFAKWFPIAGIDGDFLKDFKTMVRAHVDYALMALFNFGFYAAAVASGIELPLLACWLVAVSGFSNPTVFTIASFDVNFWDKKFWRVYSAVSFLVTTVGFSIVLLSFTQYALESYRY